MQGGGFGRAELSDALLQEFLTDLVLSGSAVVIRAVDIGLRREGIASQDGFELLLRFFLLALTEKKLGLTEARFDPVGVELQTAAILIDSSGYSGTRRAVVGQ